MNKLKKKKAGIKDFFKGKHGRNFLLALDVLLAIAFFAQPDLYYNPQAPDFFDRFYADSLIICGGLWAVLVFLTVKKIHFSAEVNRILTYIAGIATPFIAFLWLEFYNDAQFWVPIFSIPFLYLVLDIIVYYVIYVLFLLIFNSIRAASICMVVVTAVFAFYLVNYSNVSLTMKIPFWSGHYLNLGWFAVPVLFFAVIGTVNGVNFTDGLDGLASSVTLIVAVFFTVVSLGMNSGVEPITCAVVGSLMGFLLFNVYPAKVFMGDTGSLALGGFVAGVAYAMQMPLFIILVGLIYLVEVLSVMLQVSYFKATHGKRIFKMAPIHHHFELCGWSETRVVAVFSVVTAIMCLIALLAL